MIAWDIDSGIKCYFPRHKKWQVQRGPQNPDGGPILTGAPKYYDTGPGGFFFFWTGFENLVAKRWKINDRIVPILVAT